MRTPTRLYPEERIIYRPELLTCPHCGDLLVTCNYLAWDKTVQKLDRVLSVASRPGCCRHATCAGSRMRLLSAEGQRLALPGSTYGYDVLVRIGWWRQEYRATYREIHADLATQVRISVSHVGYLYQQVYLPLLACHERQHHDRLAQTAKQQGGLLVALDGLAPQGGEPQIWFIRELSSGLNLRSGWLCQQDQPTFEAFLEPLQYLEWPILAVLSDNQFTHFARLQVEQHVAIAQAAPAGELRKYRELLAAGNGGIVVRIEIAVTCERQVAVILRALKVGQEAVLPNDGLVVIESAEKLGGMAADVPCFEDDTLRDFSLQAERPFMCLLRSKIRRDGCVVEGSGIEHSSYQGRRQVSANVRSGRICQ